MKHVKNIVFILVFVISIFTLFKNNSSDQINNDHKYLEYHQKVVNTESRTAHIKRINVEVNEKIALLNDDKGKYKQWLKEHRP